jgi:hypothetical protein
VKKRTKQQREEAEKAALRKRLRDMASGAYGDLSPLAWDDEGDFTGMAAEMGLDAFGRWLGAIGRDFGGHYVEPSYLHHFDYLSTATDFLYDAGIRA